MGANPPHIGWGLGSSGEMVVGIDDRGDVVADVIRFLGFGDADFRVAFGANHPADGFGVEGGPSRLALLVVGVAGAEKAVHETGHLLFEEFVANVEVDEDGKARLHLQAVDRRRRLD